MTNSMLIRSIDNHVCTLTLNRPDQRNALHPTMIRELTESVLDADDNADVRVILLRGAGRAFCAGADLTYLEEMGKNSVMENAEDSLRLMELFATLTGCDTPLIACVHGPALAGGCGLALACDLVLASTDAQFGFPEVRIGFVPAIILKLVVRRIGEGRAREVLLRGHRLDASTAERYGMVNAAVPPEEFAELCATWTKDFVEHLSSTSTALTKQLFRETEELSMKDALHRGASMNTLSRTTEDFRNGMANFVKKK